MKVPTPVSLVRCPARLILAVGLLLTGFASTFPAQAEEAASSGRASASLSDSAARMLEDIKILASDEFEGRGVGTAGLDKAADYVAEQFQQAGLDVSVVDGGPFQSFEINDGAELGENNSLVLTGPEGRTIELKIGEEAQVCSFGGSGAFDAPVVFAGYGIEADDVGYDDFTGLDVRGKVVVVMRRNPAQSDPHGAFATAHGISRHAALTTKLSRAFQNGAVAVLFVNDPFTARDQRAGLEQQANKAAADLREAARELVAEDASEKQRTELLKKLKDALVHVDEVESIIKEQDADPLMEFGYGGTRSGKSIPCFHVTKDLVNEMLLSSIQVSLEEIETRIDKTMKPMSRPLPGWRAKGSATVETVKVPAKNVIGVLPGEGPHAEETIVIGAHYDHLGWGGEGSLAPHTHAIHNGADDNASGTVGLIELARRLASRETPLPRRVVFIAFSGEERGLLGSAAYVDDPPFPLESTVAMFNMDMIGRLEEDKLTVFGNGTSSRWSNLLDNLAEPLGLSLSKKSEGFGPSDHATFYAKRIPVLHFFTGTHSDYHRPSDDWDLINAAGTERIVSLIEKVVVATATASEAPNYLQVQGTASLERSGSRPYFGSIPDFGTDAAGYALQGVSPGSPADKAGLKGGDVIIRLGDQRIGGLDDFDLALRNFSAGEQVRVVVLRDGKEVELMVTLSSPRG